jgi:uncharacterized protein (TIGR03437 family)
MTNGSRNRKGRAVLVVLLSVCPVNAQLRRLATTHDGSVLYFDTAFRRAGTQDPIQGRIWRLAVTPGSLPELVLERPQIGPAPLPEGPLPPTARSLSNQYYLSAPFISADGSKLAFTSSPSCFGRGCSMRDNRISNLMLPGVESREIGAGGCLMSRNGKFLATLVAVAPSVSYQRGVTVIDLETGAKTMVDAQADSGSGYVIADNGISVFTGVHSLWLAQPGKPARQLLNDDSNPIQATIDAEGRTIAWTSPGGLHLLDPDTGNDRLLLSVARDAVLSDPQLSADGKLLAFASNVRFGSTDQPDQVQFFAISIDGGGLWKITTDPSGVQMAALSGNGRVLWYLSGDNGLHRVDVWTGKDTLFVDGTPVFKVSDAAIGSIARIEGAGLAGARISIAGIPVPLLSRSESLMEFQVPWEIPIGGFYSSQVIKVELATPASFFESETRFLALTHRPEFVRAIHGDWSGVISAASPARPGEVVHLYGIGFGPVDPPQITGQPAPASPPAHVVTSFTCVTPGRDNRPVDLPILFAGLAPGLLGYYQISLQLPEEYVGQPFRLTCQSPGIFGVNAEF